MLSAIKRAGWRVSKRGTIWVYYSGHGAVTEKGRVLLGTDANQTNLANSSIPLSEVVSRLTQNRRASRVVIVLDAGFGEQARDGQPLFPNLTTPVEVPHGFEYQQDNVVIWAISRDDRPSEAYADGSHGLFTWASIGALRGWADGELSGERDGKVTFGEAQAYTDRLTRSLGRATHTTMDDRPEVQDWILDQGEHLEPGPNAKELAELNLSDFTRTVTDTRTQLESQASNDWREILRLTEASKQSSSNEGDAATTGQDPEAIKTAIQEFIERYSDVSFSVERAVYVDQVREAHRVLATLESAGTEAALAESTTAQCSDLTLLEGPAMLGKLSQEQSECLDSRIVTERLQTKKDKISRVLLVNAEASGATGEWERLMHRHLEEIDRSDPDLCMRYAVFIFKNDRENLEEVIRWADYAMGNKQIWRSDEFVKKVNGLLRLRSEAAQLLWTGAERIYRKDSNEENAALAELYRGWAKSYSREWLDYARAAKQPTKTAFEMCAAAAGSMDYCKDGT